jgi:tetratricopeptide (TPR) repeat protein
MVKKLAGAKKNSETVPFVDPKSAEEFTQRGWDHYTKKEYFRAETDFRKALDIKPEHYDASYALAMTLDASGRQQEAIAEFEKVIDLLKEPGDEDIVRAHMLVRLARGHISRIKTGEWNLGA